MTSLEELLRAAAERGITHLTMAPVPSADGKTVYWRASATPSTAHKYVSTISKDPVEALMMVLTTLPMAPKRRMPPMGQTALPVTVTVTETTR